MNLALAFVVARLARSALSVSATPPAASLGRHTARWMLLRSSTPPATSEVLLLPGWRQLGWPVGDNYLGRFCTGAGPVQEAGLT